MSDQTRRDLAEAIAAHVADELAGALTGAWTLSAEAIAPDWNNGFLLIGDGSHFSQVGLLATHIHELTTAPRETS